MNKDTTHSNRIRVRFPSWKTLLWLILASFVLNNVMSLTISGWDLIDEYLEYTASTWLAEFTFSVAFTLVSISYSWGLLRFVPILRYRLAGLILYTFVLIVLNNLLAWGCYYGLAAIYDVHLAEVDQIKMVLTTAMTASFVTCIYFNLQYMSAHVDMARRNAQLETAVAQEREDKLQSQLKTLKAQISPHFMFNNFSILSELIVEDTKVAEEFLQHLSGVYRYVIQHAETSVVTVSEELRFLHSYLNLIKLRYEDTVVVNLSNDVEKAQGLIPPVALQLLVENAIKHNKRSASEPLVIDIDLEGDHIVVSNNYQPVATINSTHVGQNNIIKRYALLGGQAPEVCQDNERYTVKLPLLPLSNHNG